MKPLNKNVKYRDNNIVINTPEELEKMLIEFGYAYIPAKAHAKPGSIVWRDGFFEVSVSIPKLPMKKVHMRVFRTDDSSWLGGSGNSPTLKLPFTKYRLQHSITLGLKHVGYDK